MYLIETDIAINWTINTALNKVLVKADFDILTVDPNGDSTYITDPTTGWIAPVNIKDTLTPGAMTYTFNNTTAGQWSIHLVTGTDASYTILDTAIINLRCATPSTIITDLSAYAALRSPPVQCDLGQSLVDNRGWNMNNVQSVGRHADVGKLVFIGSHGDDAVTKRDTIGVLTRSTGVSDITTYKNNLATASNYAAPKWLGIDCDRSTGRYVAAISHYQGQPGNNPAPYYSDDLVTWTRCTVDVETFVAGFHACYYDDPLGLWVAMNTQGPYLSKDGINFYKQDFETTFGTVSYPEASKYPLWGTLTPSWMTPQEDRIVFAGQWMHMWELLPDSIPHTGSLPLRASTIREVDEARVVAGRWYPGTMPTILFGVDLGTNSINSLTLAGTRLYVMLGNEQITRSFLGGSGLAEEWDDSTYNFTLSNGWDDIPANTYAGMKWVEGVWWIKDHQNTAVDAWYRFDDPDGDGPPNTIEGGWTQDSTGPFGVTNYSTSGSFGGGVPQSQFCEQYNWPDEGWAIINTDINDWAGNPAPTYDQWIVYNEN